MARPTDDSATSGTRERLLEAAVDVLADNGMGAFTHRVIEQRAGVYHGATTHFFGSRDELIDAVFGHLFDLNADAVAEHPDVPAEPAAVVDEHLARAMIRGGMRALVAEERDALARYALVVHAAQHPRLQRSLGSWRTQIIEQTAPVLAAIGAADPEAAARLFVAGADGLLLHLLSAPWSHAVDDVDRMTDALITGALTVEPRADY